ncbi:hypothetical protein D3C81_1711990 [compost metagenome]
MAQDQADLGSGAAADHVLVGAADVGGDHLEDHAVLDFLAAWVLHFRVVDFLHLDLARAEIHHSTIARHALTSLDFLLMQRWWNAPPSMGGMCYWNEGDCGPDGACRADWKRQGYAFLRQGNEVKPFAGKPAPTGKMLTLLWERACPRRRQNSR